MTTLKRRPRKHQLLLVARWVPAVAECAELRIADDQITLAEISHDHGRFYVYLPGYGNLETDFDTLAEAKKATLAFLQIQGT